MPISTPFRMGIKVILLAVVLLSVSASLHAQVDHEPPSGDPSIVSPDARLELLFTSELLTEGPAVAPDGSVYFSEITFTAASDMAAGNIWRYDPKTNKTTIYRSPSGMSNGLKFDVQGRLVAAEGADYGGRRVTRTDLATGKAKLIAGLYEGKPFNAPNDISLDEKGRIYFSDPRYLGHEPVEQPTFGVYRIDPDLSVHLIITDAGKPNGVAVSPDQKSLYVVSNDNGSTGIFRLPEGLKPHKGRMALLAYDLYEDGTAVFREVLVDYSPEDGPDGLVCDTDGNIWVAVRDITRPGINVYSPKGKELARIPMPMRGEEWLGESGYTIPTNVAFGRGKESKTLYVTADAYLYRIKVKKEGYHLPEK